MLSRRKQIYFCDKVVRMGNIFSIVLYFGIIFSRLIPHPPNFTPVIVFAIFLATERYSFINVLMSFIISDEILSLIYHYPQFGDWTVFTYSGMLIIILASKYFKNSSLILGLSATLFYWIWTNFGVWISSGMYAHNLQGLVACYEMAIPFLINNFMGTIMGFIFIFVLLYKINQRPKLASC
jgi:hypothetical protein